MGTKSFDQLRVVNISLYFPGGNDKIFDSNWMWFWIIFNLYATRFSVILLFSNEMLSFSLVIFKLFFK